MNTSLALLRFTDSALPWLSALLDAAVQATLLVFIAGVAALLLRRKPAALRYALWVSTLTLVLVLPVLARVLPAWHILPAWSTVMGAYRFDDSVEVAAVPSESDATARELTIESATPFEQTSPTAASPIANRTNSGRPLDRLATDGSGQSPESGQVSWDAAAVSASPPSNARLTSALILIWFAGCLLCSLRLAASSIYLWSLSRRLQCTTEGPLWQQLEAMKRELGWSRPVRLLIGRRGAMPMAWGVVRPRIMIPGESSHWSDLQLRAVLLHELAHVIRRDLVWQYVVEAAKAIYWFHPLVWAAAWRAHAERERSCDDLVLNRGVAAGDYARQLLDVVSAGRIRRIGMAAGITMASTRKLEGRLRSIMDQTTNRRPPTRLALLFIAFASLLPALLVAMIRTSGAADDEQQPQQPAKSTTEFIVIGGDDRPIADGEAIVTGTTDKGKYFKRTARIKDGKATFFLESDRVQDLTVTLGAPGHNSFIKKFVQKGTGNPLPIEPQYRFKLKSGINIGGKVLDESGKPIDDVDVYVYFPTNLPIEEGFDFVETTVTTDAAGKWELSGVPADLGNMTLRIRHKSHVSSREIDKVLPQHHEGLKALADIRNLAAAPTFACTVVDPDGKPVKGAMLLLSGADLYRDYGRGEIPMTDADGRVELPKVSVGMLEFTIFSPDWALNGVKVRSPQTAPMTITMRKGKRVEFRTVDVQGKPIEGISFHPEAPRVAVPPPDQETVFSRALDFLSHRDLLKTRTNENGIFVWENAPNMKLAYQIISSQYLSQPGGEYGPEASPHTLVFRKIIPVSVTIVDAASGKPVEGARIMQGTHFKVNPIGLWSWSWEKDTTNSAGRFESKLPALDRIVRFRVQGKGYRPKYSEEFDAAALPDAPISLQLRLDADKGYSGTALQPDGRPAAGAKIYTKSKSNPQEFDVFRVVNGVVDESKATTTATADAGGKFQIPSQVEPFVCYVVHDSGYQKLMDADLFEQAELKLQPWASLKGQLSLRGVPAANIAVSLRMLNQFQFDSQLPDISFAQELRTDAAGKFGFSKCIAGEWEKITSYDETIASTVYRQRAYEHRETVQLLPGQERLEVIGKEGADVVGRVVFPKDPKIAPAESHLYVREDFDSARKNPRVRGRSSHSVSPQPDGSFRVYNLAPATHEIEIVVRITGEDFPRDGYSKKIVVTPKMFAEKSPTNPVDLGDIQVEPVK